MIFVGVETEQPEGLEESNKKINLQIGVNAYEEVFKKVHRYGISVIAGFMFGWDTDTPERIHQRVKYIRKSNADSIQSTFVTPLPGTRLYDKLRQEGRFIHDNFPDDWQRFDYGDMVFRPALMTREEFLEEMNIALNRIYDPSHLRRKFFKSWWNLKSFTTAYWSYMSNWNYRNMFIQDGKKVKNWFLDK